VAQQDKAKKQAKAPAPKGRGGARPGAGRKSGSGAFGEPTVPMRVPASWAGELESKLEAFKGLVSSDKEAAKKAGPVDWSAPGPAALAAGPSQPAGKPVDLCKSMSRHPQACFAWTAPQDDPELGLLKGDTVIIERGAQAEAGSVVAAWGDLGVELSRAPRGKKALESLAPWGVAVGVARKLG
jgi:DNA polymerase V